LLQYDTFTLGGLRECSAAIRGKTAFDDVHIIHILYIFSCLIVSFIVPSVSVIIPVFDVEPYISRCARSLFGQTLRDVEFIFIDDCTPDRSIEVLLDVLDDYPERKDQVVIYKMPQNSGQARVRMQGISLAKGEYVIHCDSDDEVALDAYEKMYLKALKEHLDVVACDFYLEQEGSRVKRSLYAPIGKEVDAILSGKVMGSLWCRLFKRSLLKGIVPPVGNMTEDVVITVQALQRAQSIGYLSEALYHYHLRGTSISKSSGKEADLIRWKSFYANSQLVVDVLKLPARHAPLVFFKYRTRYYLQRYVHLPDCYRLWRNTFPEIDRYFLFTPEIPLMEKLWFVLIHLHLYHPWKVMTGKA